VSDRKEIIVVKSDDRWEMREDKRKVTGISALMGMEEVVVTQKRRALCEVKFGDKPSSRDPAIISAKLP
jgi:hypothetical protein